MTDELNSPPGALAALADDLRQLPAVYPEGRFHGRGIVIAAGGTSTFTNAYVLVSVLRGALGCRLPIEVWHFGTAEMSPTMAQLLAEFDVETVDALPHIAAAGVDIRDGWQLKSFCLQHCGFAEVLLLDADQVPVADPAVIFDWPEYRRTGAVFWPDIVGIRADNPVWRGMGLAPMSPEISFDSGQIAVDKRRHWRALAISVGLNAAADLVYRYVYGDKDTFLLAFRLAGESFSLVPHQPFRDPHWLSQRDFEGAALFQHLVNREWRYAAEESEQAPEGFRHYEACLSALAQLRRRWNGRVFNAPDRSSEARAAEAGLVGHGRFSLEIVGLERDQIEFLAHGEFGAGRSAFRQNWWCESGRGGIELVIRDADRVTYRLRRHGDGSWQGPRFHFETEAAVLAPMLPAAPAAENGPGLADDLLRAIRFPDHNAADWERFRSALALIAPAHPGVVCRLRDIAAGLDPPTAAELLLAVDAVAPPALAPDRRPFAAMDVLETRYRPPGGPAP